MRDRKAQSLLELSIFGAILITLLGVLINYGLKNNLQQQITQRAFRKALSLAYQNDSSGQPRGSASYVYISDRHIADPSSSFGVGSVIPFSSSASITRDYRLHETADDESSLPVLAIDIKGSKCPGSNRSAAGTESPCLYLTAGFADYCIPETCGEGQVDKLEEIFGATSVWEVESPTVSCAAGEKVYRVIDSCEGEILSYSGCKRQCNMITDLDVCVRECQRGKLDEGSSSAKCNQICSQAIKTIDGQSAPWYCSTIETLFNFASSEDFKSMGIQQDYSQATTQDNLLQKTETEAGIHTTDTFNWTALTERMIIFRRYGDKSGAVERQPVEGAKTQDEAVDWEVSW